MPPTPFLLAELLASLRRAVEADAGAEGARLDAAMRAMLLTLLAALERLAGAHAIRLAAVQAQASGFAPPYIPPHGEPGPPIARHRGPVPARGRRLGRFPTWWTRNPGATAIPSQAAAPRRPQPARAPPTPVPAPVLAASRCRQSLPPPENAPTWACRRTPVAFQPVPPASFPISWPAHRR